MQDGSEEARSDSGTQVLMRVQPREESSNSTASALPDLQVLERLAEGEPRLNPKPGKKLSVVIHLLIKFHCSFQIRQYEIPLLATCLGSRKQP